VDSYARAPAAVAAAPPLRYQAVRCDTFIALLGLTSYHGHLAKSDHTQGT